MRKILLVLGLFFLFFSYCYAGDKENSKQMKKLDKALSGLVVQGVFDDKKTEPFALVNDEIVKEGDEVDGAKILEIKKDSVKFQYEGNIIVKKIGEGASGDKEKNKSDSELSKPDKPKKQQTTNTSKQKKSSKVSR